MTAHVQPRADLWTLFWKAEPPPDGHRSPGELTLTFDDLAKVVGTGLVGTGDGFCLVYAVSNENVIVHQAVVAAVNLLDTGKAMASTARFLPIKSAGGKVRIFVRYLGLTP